MAKNDEGEFELVLGNKQLLSVFFIVVVLLGVFFTMGYIVGRNTAKTAAIAQAPGQPLVVEPGGETSPAATPKPPAAKPTEAAKAQPPKPKPSAQQAAAKPKPASTPPAKQRPAPPKIAPPPSLSSTRGVSEPASGTTWLQVAATSLPEAEVLSDVLAKRGFRSRLAPVPGQDLVRVLVGPLSGSADVSQTRSKLQTAGFKPFARRY